MEELAVITDMVARYSDGDGNLFDIAFAFFCDTILYIIPSTGTKSVGTSLRIRNRNAGTTKWRQESNNCHLVYLDPLVHRLPAVHSIHARLARADPTNKCQLVHLEPIVHKLPIVHRLPAIHMLPVSGVVKFAT